MPRTSPFCAVWMVTYNHEKYLGQAIEGVINQKTNFPVKLFIGEDCSTDKTREICIHYAEKYPDKVTLLLNPKNNILKNALNTYNACFQSGANYIAMCEGDDYWTDPLKLQKQIDFLEANKDFSICFHAMNFINESNPEQVPTPAYLKKPEITTIEDLCLGNYIYTASCVFRNGLIPTLPEWYCKFPLGDWPLHLMNAEHGKIKFINEKMAVYRIHGKGIWSQLEGIKLEKQCLTVIDICKTNFDRKYTPLFLKGEIPKYKSLIRLYRLYDKKHIYKAFPFFFKLIRIVKYDNYKTTKMGALKLLILGK